MASTKTQWVLRKKREISAKPRLPGVWELRAGGFVVRARIRAPDGRTVEIDRTVQVATALEAANELARLKEEARQPPTQGRDAIPLFSDYAVSVMERRLALGHIVSGETRRRWADVLEHWLLPTFGAMRLDTIRRLDVMDWLARLSSEAVEVRRVKTTSRHKKDRTADDYETRKVRVGPRSIGTYLAQLKTILAEAVCDYGLSPNPVAGVEGPDLSVHPAYTDEEPNSLTPEELRGFLAVARERYPQHFAMIVLGFCTGLRPSTMRPIRRTGPKADIDLATGTLLIRRSQTVKNEVMEKPKTGLRQRIALPADVVQILAWHVAGLTPKQEASELLFPSDIGGFRTRSVLDKPIRAICAVLGIRKRITPRAMRRTFNDLARAAGLGSLLTRSISGHQTETMREHYSTVTAPEMREGLVRVVREAGLVSTAATAPAEAG